MKRLKILMIAPTPFFSDRGCHTRIVNEIRGLQKLGHEVILITYGLGRDLEGVTTKRIINFPWYKKTGAGPSITKIFMLPLMFFSSLSEIRKFNPDVVHAFLHEGACIAKFCSIFRHKPKYFFDMQGSLCGELLQHKFIKENGVLHKFFVRLECIISNWFPIITQSKQLKDQLLNVGVEDSNIINALDSVDTDMFSPRLPSQKLLKQFGIDLCKPTVLFMGLLETYQGADLLIDAFESVYKKNNDTQFIIIGFPNIDKYRNICKHKGIDKNTFFLGRIKYEDVPEYLSLSKIAVAPKISIFEGDGKLYNYMGMGMATVAFDRSVSREVLGSEPNKKTGLFADFMDSESLAQNIIKLIDDVDLVKTIGENARERAVNTLSHIHSAKLIEQFYYQYLNKM